jgi:UDP-GlcNAc3NAcA epimerase
VPPAIVSIVGARPQFVKAAVVSRALAARGLGEAVVHTGQHYDEAMSGRLLAELGLEITANLAVGSGSHAHQTARIMTGLQDLFDSWPEPPRLVVVYGDTNSTLAAALVAAKLGIPLAHVEAGLRSHNRAMPEEINRIVTDRIADALFCSSAIGVAELAREGITDNVWDVGDVMLDAFQMFSPAAAATLDLSALVQGLAGPFVLATIHRPANTDDGARLTQIVAALGRLAVPVLWPVHPRLRESLRGVAIPAGVHCIEPVGYLSMLGLLGRCAAVVTDSGGLQKEAHWARRPCTTLRSETEWIETLAGGWNVLVDPVVTDIGPIVMRTPVGPWKLLYGDGRAGERIADRIASLVEGAGA